MRNFFSVTPRDESITMVCWSFRQNNDESNQQGCKNSLEHHWKFVFNHIIYQKKNLKPVSRKKVLNGFSNAIKNH